MRASIYSDNWNNNCQAKKKNEKIECYLKKGHRNAVATVF